MLYFDRFHALSGVPEEDILGEQQLLGAYPSDAQTYADTLAIIDPTLNQFVSVVTMQNHVPYAPYEGDSQIEARGEGYSEGENAALQSYVRQVSDTDKATAAFLDALERIDKPIALVFYGDHLPNLYPDRLEAFSEDPAVEYQTDYFIWTNEGKGVGRRLDLNSAELIPALLETTDSRVSPYCALLTQAMWELPPELNSALRATPDLTRNQAALVEDLKLAQFDSTSGDNLLGAEFFAMPGVDAG